MEARATYAKAQYTDHVVVSTYTVDLAPIIAALVTLPMIILSPLLKNPLYAL